jgi:hypothetical protein
MMGQNKTSVSPTLLLPGVLCLLLFGASLFSVGILSLRPERLVGEGISLNQYFRFFGEDNFILCDLEKLQNLTDNEGIISLFFVDKSIEQDQEKINLFEQDFSTLDLLTTQEMETIKGELFQECSSLGNKGKYFKPKVSIASPYPRIPIKTPHSGNPGK